MSMLDRATNLILAYGLIAIIVLFIAAVIADIPLSKLTIGRGILAAVIIGLIGGGVQAVLELIGKTLSR